MGCYPFTNRETEARAGHPSQVSAGSKELGLSSFDLPREPGRFLPSMPISQPSRLRPVLGRSVPIAPLPDLVPLMAGVPQRASTPGDWRGARGALAGFGCQGTGKAVQTCVCVSVGDSGTGLAGGREKEGIFYSILFLSQERQVGPSGDPGSQLPACLSPSATYCLCDLGQGS